MEELNEIGWNQVQEINTDFNQICFCLLDSNGRDHLLKVTLPAGYPNSSPSCRANLPSLFQGKWVIGQSKLVDLITQFQTTLETFQDIWKVLDDFDQHTVVIEPINPTRADLQRRISISKFGSLRIDLSPLNPFGMPVFSFMGSETTIRPLREQVASKIHQWDYNKTPRCNFEFLLGIEFPSPESSSTELDTNQQEPCSICYAYRLDDKIPDQVCDNTSCSKPFHTKCIFDWLQSIAPSHRASSSTSLVIWGSCPYCEQKMSIRNPGYT
jgi:E3 ubiquitin-protein ligase FANCL